MGDYALTADVTARLGSDRAARLTSDTGSTPDSALIDKAIAGAEGELNSYLSQRFAVPVDVATHTGAADVLREMTLDVAVYGLAKRRPPVPQHEIDARDRAIAWARDIATGKAQLPDDEVPAATPLLDPPAVFSSETRRASRSNMANL